MGSKSGQAAYVRTALGVVDGGRLREDEHSVTANVHLLEQLVEQLHLACTSVSWGDGGEMVGARRVEQLQRLPAR